MDAHRPAEVGTLGRGARGRSLGAGACPRNRPRVRITGLRYWRDHTYLAFVFVLGVLVFVHELGHFLAAKRVGIRVLKFQLGFNPTIRQLPPRRHRVQHRRAAARRLREDGRRKPRGATRRTRQRHPTDEFLSKTKWERFQVLIMGPVMNLLLAVVLTAVVLYQGAREARVRRSAGRRRRGRRRTRSAAKAGIQPGDRIVSVAGTHGRHLGSVRHGGRHEAEPRGLARPPAQRARVTRNVTPTVAGQSRFEYGVIGVLPNVHPHSRRSLEGRARPRRPASSRATSSRRRRPDRSRSH